MMDDQSDPGWSDWSKFTLHNKLTICKSIIKPLLTYGLELWDSIAFLKDSIPSPNDPSSNSQLHYVIQPDHP